MEDLNGNTVSAGWPKFFNMGQGPDGLRVELPDILAAVELGDATATLKVDGSLLIRSIYGGEVIFRTRGSFGYEHLANAHEMGGFRRRYPRLFEIDCYPNLSLLFEWTSPENIIVLKYDEPDLTLTGAVDHSDMSLLTMKELEGVSKELGVPIVPHFPLTTWGWDALYKTLDRRQDIEGYVIRLSGEQELVKIKCVPYLTKHALKSSLDSEHLADLYFEWGQPDYTEFGVLFSAAFDEETLMWALGAISALYDGVREYKKILAHMSEKVLEWAGKSRKDVALWGLGSYGHTKRFSLFMNLWEGREPKMELHKTVLLQVTKQVEVGMWGDK